MGTGKQKPEVDPESGKISRRVQREPAEWYRAEVGATAEAVGAEEPEHGVERASPEKSDDGTRVEACG